jgi:hypothetical protein
MKRFALILCLIACAGIAFGSVTHDVIAKGGVLQQKNSSGTSRTLFAATTGILTATPQATTVTAWTLTPTTTTGTGLIIDAQATLTTGTLVRLVLDTDVLTTGSFINCLGGTDHATSCFSVKTGGNTAVGGTLVVTGASTLTGAVGTTAGLTVGTTLAVTGAATLSSTATGPGGGAVIYRKLVTKTRAELIAGGFYGNGTDVGCEILPAITGRSYRVLNARVYVDTVALTATATASGVRLVSAYTPGSTGTILLDVPIANLIRATAAGAGFNSMLPATSNNVLLIDGGSFATQTANKSIILIGVAGVDWLGTGANINVGIEYVVL